MKEVKICKLCLYDSNHPLGLEINNEGICSGCLIHQEKNNLDWGKRWVELEELIRPYRCKQNVKYDCIVPVTGANDSYYIMHLVKNKLKLNPLVVTYNKYFNTPLGIRNLANLRTKFNVDILMILDLVLNGTLFFFQEESQLQKGLNVTLRIPWLGYK